MARHALALRCIFLLLALLVWQTQARGQDSELTEEELRALIEQGDWEALGLVDKAGQPPETHAEKVQAIRSHREGSLELAAQMLATGDARVQRDVLDALRDYDTQDALDLLQAQAAGMDLMSRPRDSVQGMWARVFRNRYGDRSDDLAIAAIEDPATGDLDRALHLLVLASADRELALTIYARYLEDPAADVQLAALMVNSAHGDLNALPILLRLESGSHPRVRGVARGLVGRYLRWGEARPGPGKTTLDRSFVLAHPVPYDAEGLKAWHERAQAWARQQYILIHGEEPPEAKPPKTESKFHGVAGESQPLRP
jgi:hypothetical protein